MKKYKTWEVIKMLTENPKLKFQCKVFDEEDILRLYINEDGYLEMNNTGVDNGLEGNICVDDIDDMWTLIQEPISFMEVINSGKKIRYEKWSNYVNIKDALLSLIYPNLETISDMINGNWYIEED